MGSSIQNIVQLLTGYRTTFDGGSIIYSLKRQQERVL